MSVTVTVLGGSAASVGTGQGCAGYLVAMSGTSLVLDLGPGTLQELRKHTDFRALDAVVISHLHVDHMLDVVAMRFALAYNPVKPAALVALWLPPGGIALLQRLGEAFDFEGDATTFFSRVFDVREYDPDQPLAIGEVDADLRADCALGALLGHACAPRRWQWRPVLFGGYRTGRRPLRPCGRVQGGDRRGHHPAQPEDRRFPGPPGDRRGGDPGGASRCPHLRCHPHVRGKRSGGNCSGCAATWFDGEIVRALPGTVIAWP